MRYPISGKQSRHRRSPANNACETELAKLSEVMLNVRRTRMSSFSKSVTNLSAKRRCTIDWLTASGEAHATDIYGSCRFMCGEDESNWRRYKRRLKHHHRGGRAQPLKLFGASSYILASESDSTRRKPKPPTHDHLPKWDQDCDLSVGEGLMQMEISG